MKKIIFATALLSLTSITFAKETNSVKTSTTSDQVSVNVTVYNNGMSLIRDSRKITLPKGVGELRFEEIAQNIKPSSVLAKSLSNPNAFEIIEQNYEYDLLNSDKLLDKYVGKEIKLLTENPYQDKKELKNATLLSNNNGQIFKIGEEIYLGHNGTRILPKIPENLIANPTLMWKYSNKFVKAQNIEVTYLTNNLSWEADYVFLISNNDKTGDLNGWVTINNRSGATYNNAGLKLVAGDVNRVMSHDSYGGAEVKMMAAEAPRANGRFKEKSFFEYHLYTLPNKTTIKNNQSKQIKLLSGSNIKTEKELIINHTGHRYTHNSRGQIQKPKIDVYMKFKNAKENSLGVPLPKGIVRVYKNDSDDSPIFIGEDRIDHTPEDEEVKLKIGKAFDVVAEKVQTEYIKQNNKTHISSWKVTIKNRKKESVEISLLEALPAYGEITKSTDPFEKSDAFTAKFKLNIPAGKEKIVKYTVKVKY